MPQTITIGHVSDLHLGPLPAFMPRHWNVKRALGVVNWMRKRRTLHQAHVWQLIRDDLKAQQPDHIVVSGDLCNLGLPGEHAAAAAWLHALGSPDTVTVVPGNHDIYCRLWTDPGVERWRGYMTSDDAGRRYLADAAAGFPFVRMVRGLALVGVNSAIPTRPGEAVGEVGEAQLARLAATLARLGAGPAAVA